MPQATEKQKKNKLSLLLARFPSSHLALVGGLGVILLGTLMFSPSSESEAPRMEQRLSLALNPDNQWADEEQDNPSVAAPQAAAAKETMAEPREPTAEWHEETVKSGDNLSLIFHRAGLSDRQLIELMNSLQEAKQLTKILPGHRLQFLIDSEDQLQELRYHSNKLKSQIYTKAGTDYTYQEQVRNPDVQYAYRSTTIENSLFLDGKKSGMSDRLIMELAGIFGWDIDFVLDIREGDAVYIMYEEKFLDGEKLGNGDILAATFINQGQPYKAVRYIDSHGDKQYYTPEGSAMRKDFLRAPLDFTRVSSNFNPKRLHPIFKTVRPHRGIDYAAPRGTPVYSAGNGRVIASGYTKPNGNYIVIQHGNNIQTKYLHLQKRLVKKGQRVKQKQLIGKVGTTGYSTAPHLHYEFLLDGVHRNPRTIVSKLPKAKSIPENELMAFKQQVAPLLTQLANFESQIQLASNQTNYQASR